MKVGFIGWMILMLAGLLLPATVLAGESGWTTHSYMNDIYDLDVTDDGVWCATDAGALFFSFADSDLQSWNRCREGLASDTLTSVSQLSDGRIAFGTAASGISVHNPDNGYWYNYNSSVWSLADNAIRFISEEGLWRIIGTPKGFSAFYNGEPAWNRICQEGIDLCDLPGWDIKAGIFFDGYIWLGAWAGAVQGVGVARLNYNNPAADPNTYDTANEGLTSLDIREFTVWDDQLYCVSNSEVNYWDGDEWIAMTDGLPAVTDRVGYRDIHAGATRLYLAVTGETRSSDPGGQELYGGIFYLEAGETTWTRLGTERFHAECVAEGNDGVVWVGTVSRKLSSGNWYADHIAHDGLWEYVGGQWIQHRKNGPDVIPFYRALAMSESGVLWCAAADGGRGWSLTKNDQDEWTTYTKDNSQITNAWILNLTADGDDLWLGHCCCSDPVTACPIDSWASDDSEVETYRSVYNIFDSTKDDWGNLWFGSWFEHAADHPDRVSGLHHWDKSADLMSTYTVESTNELMQSNAIAAVTAEGEYLWIGYMDKGVSRTRLASDGSLSISPGDWTHYEYESSSSVIQSNGITSMASRPGEVWIGTDNGLSIWTNSSGSSSWEIYRSAADRLPGSTVIDIALTDESGWVAISGQGVTRMKPTSTGDFEFTTFTTPDLVNANVRVLLAGNQGDDIWAGTINGLSHYSPTATSVIESIDKVEVYPNPYNPNCDDPWLAGSSRLRFKALPGTATSGVIVDVAGNIIHRFAGPKVTDDILWEDGRDQAGNPVAPGLYIVKVSTPRGWLTGQIAVIDLLPCD